MAILLVHSTIKEPEKYQSHSAKPVNENPEFKVHNVMNSTNTPSHFQEKKSHNIIKISNA
jgi:hypothetical protein